MATWLDNRIGWGIAGLSLDADGNPVGEPFRVNSSPAGAADKPQVTLLNNGGTAFAWQGGKAGFQRIYARFMNGGGSFVTDDVLVSGPIYGATNRSTVTWQVWRNNRLTLRRFRVFEIIDHRRDSSASPAIAALQDGTVVVAYSSYVKFSTNNPATAPQVRFYGSVPATNTIVLPLPRVQDHMHEVFFRRFTPGGLPIGEEVRINQNRAFNQRNPAVAALDNGNFVAVWTSDHRQIRAPGGETNEVLQPVRVQEDGIYARIFNAAGAALTDEFRVDDFNLLGNGTPAVAGLTGGAFRVAWAQKGTNVIESWDIATRQFNSAGAAVSGVSRVNSTAVGDQFAPRIASCPAGEIVVWTSLRQDGSQEGVFGQWISGGSALGGEFQVNTTTAGRQYQQGVAASPQNRVIVGWTGPNSSSPESRFEVFAQRY